jgi:hypothetical protein
MDRDDPNQYRDDGNPEDTAYGEGMPPENAEDTYEAASEWEQPVDDFADETAEDAEIVETDGLGPAGTEEEIDMYAEPEEPVEEEYVQKLADEDDEFASMEDEPPAPETGRNAGKIKPEKIPGQPSLLTRVLPYLGGGLAAVVLAFFGFQQFSGMMSAPAPQEMPVAENTPAPAPAPAPENLASTLPAPGNTQPANPPQPVWDAQPAGNNTATNNTTVLGNVPPPAAEPLPLPPPPAPAPVAEVVPSAPLPSSSAIPVPLPPPAPAAVPSAVPNTAIADMESKIADLTRQLSDLKSSQEQMSQKIQAAPQQPSVEESVRNASQALEERIKQLEQKVASAPASTASSSSAPAPSASTSAPAASEDAAKTDKPKRASRTRKGNGSTDFMASNLQREVNGKKASRTRKSALPSDDLSDMPSLSGRSWVLRSAVPGTAWLSQGVDSTDLKRVVPGDKVPGLGTIVSVRRWLAAGWSKEPRVPCVKSSNRALQRES